MSYREEMLRTAPCVDTKRDMFLLGSMGLAGETGEVVDLLKKHLFHGKDLDKQKLILELGDVRWYLECLCVAAETTIEEVEKANIQKLTLRYPKGFTKFDAEARKDE